MDSSRPVGNLQPWLLKAMYTHGFVKWSPTQFTLKSGKQSHVYVFGREDITDNPPLLHVFGREIRNAALLAFSRLAPTMSLVPCLIGIPTAGTPLAQAAAMVDFFEGTANGTKMCFRIMREAKKKHGAHQGWVNGAPDLAKHLYFTVDNVVTDGQSKVEAAERLLEDGYPAYDMPQVILVARDMRIVPALHTQGFKHVIVLFALRDIINGFAERSYWTKEMAVQALSEFAE